MSRQIDPHVQHAGRARVLAEAAARIAERDRLIREREAADERRRRKESGMYRDKARAERRRRAQEGST